MLLLVVTAPALFLRLDSYPPFWLDEGSTSHSAALFAERGLYGRLTKDGFEPFHPGVSTGPATVLPIAASFKVFGVGIFQGRLVVACFTLLAVVFAYSTAAFLYGPRAALLAVLFSLAVPEIGDSSFLLAGRQMLGEAPAFAFLMLAFCLWFASWRDEWRAVTACAGFVFGLAVLSKAQLAIPLLPALATVALLRALGRPSRLRDGVVLLGTLGLVLVAWFGLGEALTPAAVRRENAALLREALHVNFFTGLYGAHLQRGTAFMIAIMLVAVAGVVLRLRRRSTRDWMARDWGEAALAVFVAYSAAWFTFGSIGWARYAYFSFTLALLLAAAIAWESFVLLCHRLAWPYLPDAVRTPAVLALAATVLALHVWPVVRFDQPLPTAAAAAFLRENVPRDATIESWEWELDALSGRWTFHHPSQRLLHAAIVQRFHENREMELAYDVLQADPDYLVRGPFGDWTGVYSDASIAPHFERIATFGPYRIYQRRR